MSCTSQTYNLPCHTSGDTFDGVQFSVLLNSVAVNLTGAIMVMKVYDNYKKNVLTINSGAGITTLNATGGVFQIDAQRILLAAQIYFYEIEIIFVDLSVKTYIKGTWTISQ